MEEKNKIIVLDELKDIFENVNRWLTFAEGKHAILIAIQIEVLVNVKSFNEVWVYMLVISIMISLGSFIPCITKNIGILSHNIKNYNLIFFNDIAQYRNSEAYLEDIYKRYMNETPKSIPQIERHYAEEIWINSKNCIRKYMLFKMALCIDVFASVVYMIIKAV